VNIPAKFEVRSFESIGSRQRSSVRQLQYKIDGPKFADTSIARDSRRQSFTYEVYGLYILFSTLYGAVDSKGFVCPADLAVLPHGLRIFCV